MHVFCCASREGGYLNSRISRHFMALEMLENRIPGNHNCLLTIRSRLIALCCRLGWHRLISSLCCNIDRPARGSSETSVIVICSTVILITHIHLSSVIRGRGSKLFRVSVISGRTAFWLRSRFPFFPRFSSGNRSFRQRVSSPTTSSPTYEVVSPTSNVSSPTLISRFANVQNTL